MLRMFVEIGLVCKMIQASVNPLMVNYDNDKARDIDTRPALMAMWSKALPLTARCCSPLPQFKSRPAHVGKLPMILD